ncbi:S9 family peptidase [[Flexibacter] sp. ATCC 35208]|uniref:alpha/beta hydrolase family protein n=1 Tax=[Flexibacter] sp. ATCC 35208 TaxID=1936242 RepID=UPI0011814C2D|nr:prolyl oligopeptidase family serine peptidase [[Flexibacter] sp. ATCC 35208]
MKYIIFLFAIIGLTYKTSMAQKRSFQIEDLNNWPAVSNAIISDNGEYAAYFIENQPTGKKTLVIQSNIGSWKRKIIDAKDLCFSKDSHLAIFINQSNNLCLMRLGFVDTSSISNVNDFKLFTIKEQEYILYQTKTPEKCMVIMNLKNFKKQLIENVTSYVQSFNNKSIVLYKEGVKNHMLFWFDLQTGIERQIWEGNALNKITIDTSGCQAAFIENQPAGNKIWYYKYGAAPVAPIVTDQIPELGDSLTIEPGYPFFFSKNEEYLFFPIKEKPLSIADNHVKVDIWNWQDAKLQSQQLTELNSKKYWAVVNLLNKKILRLNWEDEEIRFDDRLSEFVLVTHNNGDFTEAYWNESAKNHYFLVSLKSGKRKEIPIIPEKVSPDSHLILGTDSLGSDEFSFELTTGKVFNLTKQIPLYSEDFDFDRPQKIKPRGLSIAGWLPTENAVLIYDKFDIWKVDLLNKLAPVNITSGYGRANQVILRFTNNEDGQILKGDENVLIRAFNKISKDNGFYFLSLKGNRNPQLLTMGPYIYDLTYPFPASFSAGESPIKSSDKDIYLIAREDARNNKNYFTTKDFKHFKQLSYIYPERNYNWLSTRLISFPMLDNTISQGIIYTPENFDSTKKYPAIINYYEQLSDRLNQYLKPETMDGQFNIPWFVSQGYIVFTPDIHYTVGATGESAKNAIVGAANFLYKYSWIDSSKIGIQGHSFGGYETNYIVTHSNCFSAAVSLSGISDCISYYGSLDGINGFGKSHQFQMETSQNRIGFSLWERSDLFIKNSPIFSANEVTTPLLLMNNKMDGRVNFEQGVEFFTALRRLKKEVWMLQYDDEDHTLSKPENKVDLTLRITQFFDYYLKSKPCPSWIKKGIPAKKKGTYLGYNFEG